MHLFKVQMEVLGWRTFLRIFLFFSFASMKNRKPSNQIECPQSKFQCTNITNQCSSVQGRHNIAYICEVESSWKVENYTIDEHPIMHILLIYKLATKQLEIKNQSKRHKQPRNQKNYPKIENYSQKSFHKNMCQKGIWFPSHLNLIMSLLGAKELQPRTKTQNTK